MPVIATAGHVDHGKSTLVRALTGRDPDRWDEEQRRGLTIDLGFAWTRLGDVDVGFVDVPGHERFLKNMLAGIDGADAALFVVAADEGWMPQSEEHLSVLDVLGIGPGVVALTRADLVDEDTLELAALMVGERLAGTPLEGSPAIPTAAPDGTGIDELRTALASVVSGAEPRDIGRPRLWIDRVFAVEGAGTVITGTLVDGELTVGDAVALYPERTPARVRGLQVHEQTVERAGPGNRVAVNLSGVDRARIARGWMLGRDGDWRPTRRFLAAVSPVRGADRSLGERGSFHVHAGSGSWPARLRMAGDAGMALVEARAPIPLAAGDRFVLRDVGMRAVVGGGTVLDPHPAGRIRAVRRTLENFAPIPDDPNARADALLAARGVAPLPEIEADSGGGRPGRGLLVGDTAVSWASQRDLQEAAERLIDNHHRDHPFRRGIPRAELAERLGVVPDVVDALVGTLDGIRAEEGTVGRESHRPVEDAVADPAWADAREMLAGSGMAPPRTAELGLSPEVLHALVRSGEIVDVSGEFSYLPATLDEIVARVRDLDDGFTVGDFRDALGITRKHAVPLLEWLDTRGITRREGDGRVIRR